jgi:hypothetical protein
MSAFNANEAAASVFVFVVVWLAFLSNSVFIAVVVYTNVMSAFNASLAVVSAKVRVKHLLTS